MILRHPQIESDFDFSGPVVPTLVVESPSFFRKLLTDLYAQQSGESGDFALLDGNKELSIGTWIELVDNCLRVELNSRTLLNKVATAMEKVAVNEEFFLKTADLMQRLEQYVGELAFSFDGDLVCERCTVAGVLKGIGLSFRDDYDDPLERLTDYMELVREYERDKLFVLTNIRSFFDDEPLERFFDTIATHGFHVFMIDNIARKRFVREKRTTIDADLCEF